MLMLQGSGSDRCISLRGIPLDASRPSTSWLPAGYHPTAQLLPAVLAQWLPDALADPVLAGPVHWGLKDQEVKMLEACPCYAAKKVNVGG